MTGQREPTAPTEGMPSPTQAKFTQPLSCPLWQLELEALFLVHLVVSGFGVQLLWKVFGEPQKSKSEFGVEAVKKLDSDQHHWFDTTLNFDEEKTKSVTGSNLSEGFERSN